MSCEDASGGGVSGFSGMKIAQGCAQRQRGDLFWKENISPPGNIFQRGVGSVLLQTEYCEAEILSGVGLLPIHTPRCSRADVSRFGSHNVGLHSFDEHEGSRMCVVH